MRKRTTIWGAAILAAGTAGVPPANAQSEAPRQTYSERFTTDQPGALTGRSYAIDWVNPANPDGKPHSFSHLHVELAPGARFDTSAIPQCRASDAELMVAGASACPRDSVVADEETVVDTGFPGSGRFVNSDLTFFNNRNELVILATVRENGARVVLRGQVGVNTIDLDVPPLPGTPPDGGATKRQRGTWYARSSVRDRRQVNYLTTPATCPSSGFWVNRLTYTYRDGVTQTVASRAPCRAAGGAAPRVSLRFLLRPSRSAATFNRRRQVSITVEPRGGSLRGVRASLQRGGRTFAVTSFARLDRRRGVRLFRRRTLTPGVYTLVLSGRDAAGRAVRATARMRFGP